MRQYIHNVSRNPLQNAKQCGYDSDNLKYLHTKDLGDEQPELVDFFVNQYGEIVQVFCCDIHGS